MEIVGDLGHEPVLSYRHDKIFFHKQEMFETLTLHQRILPIIRHHCFGQMKLLLEWSCAAASTSAPFAPASIALTPWAPVMR